MSTIPRIVVYPPSWTGSSSPTNDLLPEVGHHRRIAMPIPQTVKTRLDREHVHYDVLPHPQAFRATAVARTLHVPEQQMAKAVIVKVKTQFVTTVLPAKWRVDLPCLRKMFGTHRVRLATEQEIKGLFPDCELGAMPPLGTLYGLPVYVDRSLTRDEQIIFEGGTHSEAIRMRYWDFAALVFPVVADFHCESMARC